MARTQAIEGGSSNVGEEDGTGAATGDGPRSSKMASDLGKTMIMGRLEADDWSWGSTGKMGGAAIGILRKKMVTGDGNRRQHDGSSILDWVMA